MAARVIYLDDRMRRYPRSIREAFPFDDTPCAIGITGAVVIPLGRAPWWVRALKPLVRGIDRVLFRNS